jgi:hypothetical protein
LAYNHSEHAGTEEELELAHRDSIGNLKLRTFKFYYGFFHSSREAHMHNLPHVTLVEEGVIDIW